MAIVVKKYNNDDLKGYDTEVVNLILSQHPHVVKLIGISYDVNPCIILEFMENGTLQDAIENKFYNY